MSNSSLSCFCGEASIAHWPQPACGSDTRRYLGGCKVAKRKPVKKAAKKPARKPAKKVVKKKVAKKAPRKVARKKKAKK
jgi:hypothetical protein